MYLNLNAGPSAAYGSSSRASQNWVTVTMEALDRYAVLVDAAQLGNGCSGPVRNGKLGPVPGVIGPAGGVPVCPAGATGCTPGVAPYTGTNTVPVPHP